MSEHKIADPEIQENVIMFEIVMVFYWLGRAVDTFWKAITLRYDDAP